MFILTDTSYKTLYLLYMCKCKYFRIKYYQF